MSPLVAICLVEAQAGAAPHSASAWTSTLVTRKATSRRSSSTRSATAGELGEGEAGLERGERLLLLVVAVVVAADHKQRRAALDRVGRFQIGVVGARHRMVVLGGELALREPQPDETVIGAVGDRAGQLVDRRGVALGLVIGVGRRAASRRSAPAASCSPGCCRSAPGANRAPRRRAPSTGIPAPAPARRRDTRQSTSNARSIDHPPEMPGAQASTCRRQRVAPA